MYVAVENDRQIERVARLAKEIWTNHFSQMIGKDILDLIIDHVQSKEAIKKQIDDGFLYYLIPGHSMPVGYFAYRISKQEGELHLSKLYILASQRRKGIGRQVLQHLEKICKIESLLKLSLTVYDKNTSAINAYQKMGFISTGTISRDLGNGIVLKDYRMEKSVKSN
jgi:ribosomal protein S18 acetylase RimI-like enzyme